MNMNKKIKEKKYLLLIFFILAIILSSIAVIKLLGVFEVLKVSMTNLGANIQKYSEQPQSLEKVNSYSNNSDSNSATTALASSSSQNNNVVNSLQYSQVASGNNFEVVLKTDGTVWSWGNNKYGSLGNGKIENVSEMIPNKVVGIDGIGNLENIKQITAGGYFAAALTNDGKVVGWGYNAYGQLGNNSTTNMGHPVYMKKEVEVVDMHKLKLRIMNIH